MVSAGDISWNAQTDVHFIDTNKTKVNSECYMNLYLITDFKIPDCRRLCPDNDFIFQHMEPHVTQVCYSRTNGTRDLILYLKG